MREALEAMAGWAAAAVEAVRPPRAWVVPVILVAGAGAGLGAAVLHISNATSYMSDDPRACINCHIMAPQYATWERGSHARVATCNDCHVPHDTLVRKFAFKAQDGLRHASMFTLRMEPQVIRIKEAGIGAVQENCMRCHADLVGQVPGLSGTGGPGASASGHGEGRLCWDCHRDVPHGRGNSLASAPYARVPVLAPPVPGWIEAIVGTAPRAAPAGEEPGGRP